MAKPCGGAVDPRTRLPGTQVVLQRVWHIDANEPQCLGAGMQRKTSKVLPTRVVDETVLVGSDVFHIHFAPRRVGCFLGTALALATPHAGSSPTAAD